MRILHTSDWHLGRTFHGRLLDDAQAAFADHLVELARCEEVDAVVVSGDVYDRAIPPTDSVRLLDDTLRRLSDVTRVILTPGNHDSAQRLGFGADLLREGLTIRARTAEVGRPSRASTARTACTSTPCPISIRMPLASPCRRSSPRGSERPLRIPSGIPTPRPRAHQHPRVRPPPAPRRLPPSGLVCPAAMKPSSRAPCAWSPPISPLGAPQRQSGSRP